MLPWLDKCYCSRYELENPWLKGGELTQMFMEPSKQTGRVSYIVSEFQSLKLQHTSLKHCSICVT